MPDTINSTSLSHWRTNPILFIEQVLCDPETKQPFKLLDAERRFLEHAFVLDEDGKLRYPEQVYSCPKKSGKTTYAGIQTLTTVLLFGGAYPEATLCANDKDQAAGRVFTMVRRIIECSPMLKKIAKITEFKITFPSLNVTITAIPASFAGAAGGNQNISVFDENWAYVSERSRRLWDEMIPPPTRRIGCRLSVTYAGFEGESTLLEELYKRGKQQPEIGPDLYAGDGILMFWSHTPVAPWQDQKWLDEMRRSLRPSAYQRLVLNEFASAEAQFVNMPAWDACVRPDLTPAAPDKAIADMGWSRRVGEARQHRVGRCHLRQEDAKHAPRAASHVRSVAPMTPLISKRRWSRRSLDWSKQFSLRKVYFDPYQLVAVAQRLAKAHIKVEEYPQTLPNLTAATQCLFDTIQSRSLALYPDAAMRLAVSRAVIVESSRGWRLDKLKQQHKIDVIVALGMACLAAVKGQDEPHYDLDLLSRAFAVDGDTPRPQARYRLVGNHFDPI